VTWPGTEVSSEPVFVYQIGIASPLAGAAEEDDFVHGRSAKTSRSKACRRYVCIGDRYQIGSAVFEVTQPRVTCYRVGIRMNEPRSRHC